MSSVPQKAPKLPAKQASLETDNCLQLSGFDHMPGSARIFMKTGLDFQLTCQNRQTAVVL